MCDRRYVKTKMLFGGLLLNLALIGAVGGILHADDSQWKAGLAKRKITPQERVYLAGYAARNRPFESVADDLYVKAIALEDARGHRGIIVTSDLIGYRAAFAEPICAEIQKQTGLERGQILLNSSHTHTGPALSLDPTPRSPGMTPAQAEATVAYTRQLMQDTAAVAVEAMNKLEPARLTRGTGVANFVMNRREFTPQGVRLGVNPSGLADRAVPVLRVDSPDGQLRAVLFGAACHNTTLGGGDYMISGDFAGIAQHQLEQKFRGVQAMFVQGCAGSANPYPRRGMPDALVHGEELGAEVSRVLGESLSSVGGPLKTEFDYAELPLARAPTKEELEQLQKGRGWEPWVAEQMLAVLDAGEELPRSYRCPVAVWQFGQDLTLVALSGEVVVDYVPLIQRSLGQLNLWISAYSNDVFGYLPSADVLSEGGYETRGLIYGGVGFFAPDAQDALVSKVRTLATRAGRALPQ